MLGIGVGLDVAGGLIPRTEVGLSPSVTAPGSLDVSTFKIGTVHTITSGTAVASGGGSIAYETRWLVGGAVAAATATYTPVAGDDGLSIVAQWRAIETGGSDDGATSWQTVASGVVTNAAPVAGSLVALSEIQGTGPFQIDLAAGFTGDDLTYTEAEDWASISGSTMTIVDVARTTTITITATNSGGSATVDLSVEIIAASAGWSFAGSTISSIPGGALWSFTGSAIDAIPEASL